MRSERQSTSIRVFEIVRNATFEKLFLGAKGHVSFRKAQAAHRFAKLMPHAVSLRLLLGDLQLERLLLDELIHLQRQRAKRILEFDVNSFYVVAAFVNCSGGSELFQLCRQFG